MKRSLFVVLVIASFALACNATAQSTSTPYLVELVGLEDAVFRQFQSTQIVGLQYLSVEIAQFDSSKHAGEAISTIRERALAHYALTEDITNVKETSSRKIADRTYVYSGEAQSLASSQKYTIALTFVRNGSLLYIVQALAVVGDPVSDSLDTVAKILDRVPGPTSKPTSANQFQAGGLWDLLPALEDIPEGLIHLSDARPKPFEPLPDQMN